MLDTFLTLPSNSIAGWSTEEARLNSGIGNQEAQAQVKFSSPGTSPCKLYLFSKKQKKSNIYETSETEQ